MSSQYLGLHRAQPASLELVEHDVGALALAHEHAPHRVGAGLATASVVADQQLGDDDATGGVDRLHDERVRFVEAGP